jgi:hypothetical protein
LATISQNSPQLYPLTKNLSGRTYSIVTNKEAKSYKKGTILAIVTRTKTETVINHLRIGSYKRNQVIEINHDIFNSMKLISRKVFPKAENVDLFHVQNYKSSQIQIN